jgi:hypothetical protein
MVAEKQCSYDRNRKGVYKKSPLAADALDDKLDGLKDLVR